METNIKPEKKYIYFEDLDLGMRFIVKWNRTRRAEIHLIYDR